MPQKACRNAAEILQNHEFNHEIFTLGNTEKIKCYDGFGARGLAQLIGQKLLSEKECGDGITQCKTYVAEVGKKNIQNIRKIFKCKEIFGKLTENI